jgi:hypothetical protein
LGVTVRGKTDVMSDLRDWLRRNNFEQYADAFGRDNKDEARAALTTALDAARSQGAIILQRRAEASISELSIGSRG